jgi:hypothetical protein
MYRRIEIIDEWVYKKRFSSLKTGLCGGTTTDDVAEAWIGQLKGVGTGKNNRYYFTEKGWKEVGRYVVEKLQAAGQRYRIIKLKHNEVEVMATDRKFEVAVRPRKPKHTNKRQSTKEP